MEMKQKPYAPKWMYHKEKGAMLVQSMAHEKFLGEDWAESPAVHGNITHPMSAAQEFMGIEEPFFEDMPEDVIEAPVVRRAGRPKKQE